MTYLSTRLMAAASLLALLGACEGMTMGGPAGAPSDPLDAATEAEGSEFDVARPVGAPYEPGPEGE